MTYVTTREDQVTSSTTSSGGATTMGLDKLSTQAAVLIGVIIVVITTGIVILSLEGKDINGLTMAVLMILAALGVASWSTAQQVKNQTNGTQTALLTQIENLNNTVKDLALRVPPQQVPQDQTQELPRVNDHTH